MNNLTICGISHGAKVESVPSQVECSIVGTLHTAKDVAGLMIPYFQVIYRLMLAGFCLLCSTAIDVSSSAT